VSVVYCQVEVSARS